MVRPWLLHVCWWFWGAAAGYKAWRNTFVTSELFGPFPQFGTNPVYMNLYDRLMCKYSYDDFQQAVIRSFTFILPAPPFCLGFVFTPQHAHARPTDLFKHTWSSLTGDRLLFTFVLPQDCLSFVCFSFRGKWLPVHQKVAHPAGPSNSYYTSAFPRSPFPEPSGIRGK